MLSRVSTSLPCEVGRSTTHYFPRVNGLLTRVIIKAGTIMHTQPALPEYRYTGARAMVMLHEHYLRRVRGDWKRAKAADVKLPVSTDPAYVSLEALLAHMSPPPAAT